MKKIIFSIILLMISFTASVSAQAQEGDLYYLQQQQQQQQPQNAFGLSINFINLLREYGIPGLLVLGTIGIISALTDKKYGKQKVIMKHGWNNQWAVKKPEEKKEEKK